MPITKNESPAQITLFTSPSSINFGRTMRAFEKIRRTLESSGGQFDFKIVDALDPKNAGLLETHKIEALPTLCFQDVRFIGVPNPETILSQMDDKQKKTVLASLGAESLESFHEKTPD